MTTSYVMLLISERRPLFRFQEPGYDPTAIAASRYFEIATVALLGAAMAAAAVVTAQKRRIAPVSGAASFIAWDPYRRVIESEGQLGVEP